MLERSVSEARSELAELANRVAFGGERVVITRHGRPLMALVPVGDLAAHEPAPATTEASRPADEVTA